MEKIKETIQQYSKEIFKGADSRFQLMTCLQISLIPLISLLFTGFVLWVFVALTHVFFESNGLLVHQDLREAFFDAIISEVLYFIPYAGVFITALFFLGHYISNLLLRPFKFISDYTMRVYQNHTESFNPDYISELKLPISFGVRFFHFLSEARRNKKLSSWPIENKYARINKPIFDSVFFMHYFLLLGLACSVGSWGIYLFTHQIHDKIINLALSLLKTQSSSLIHFLNGQKDILDAVTTASILVMACCYAFLGKMIVNRVNGVSYNFFRTMRDFMAGNFNARVILRKNDPGHSYADSFNRLIGHIVNDEIKEIDWQRRNDDHKKAA